MSSHSGTIGRSRGLSVGGQIRRQRSVEWHHEHGYSSSEEDDRIGRGSLNPSFDSQLLAQLIAQSQQLANIDKSYLTSDCNIDDLHQQQQLLQHQNGDSTMLYSTSSSSQLQQQQQQHQHQQNSADSPNTVSNRSPLQLRQASPFPMESTNSRRIHYVNPQERLRSSGEAIYATSGKSMPISNSTLLRTTGRSGSSGGGGGGGSGRHHQRGSGMTSSSSASSNSNNNLERNREREQQREQQREREREQRERERELDKEDLLMQENRPTLLLQLHNDLDDDEPPPEPAPPEVPPRAQSLLASIKKLSSHTIKVDDSGDLKHEEFIPQSQQHEYLMTGSPRTAGYPARSPMASESPIQHRYVSFNFLWWSVMNDSLVSLVST